MSAAHKLTVSFAFGCDGCGSSVNMAAHDVLCDRCKPASRGLAIRPPTQTDGLTAAEVAQWHDSQRVLNADSRTAGSAPRPAWLVDRVLSDARGGQ